MDTTSTGGGDTSFGKTPQFGLGDGSRTAQPVRSEELSPEDQKTQKVREAFGYTQSSFGYLPNAASPVTDRLSQWRRARKTTQQAPGYGTVEPMRAGISAYETMTKGDVAQRFFAAIPFALGGFFSSDFRNWMAGDRTTKEAVNESVRGLQQETYDTRDSVDNMRRDMSQLHTAVGGRLTGVSGGLVADQKKLEKKLDEVVTKLVKSPNDLKLQALKKQLEGLIGRIGKLITRRETLMHQVRDTGKETESVAVEVSTSVEKAAENRKNNRLAIERARLPFALAAHSYIKTLENPSSGRPISLTILYDKGDLGTENYEKVALSKGILYKRVTGLLGTVSYKLVKELDSDAVTETSKYFTKLSSGKFAVIEISSVNQDTDGETYVACRRFVSSASREVPDEGAVCRDIHNLMLNEVAKAKKQMAEGKSDDLDTMYANAEKALYAAGVGQTYSDFKKLQQLPDAVAVRAAGEPLMAKLPSMADKVNPRLASSFEIDRMLKQYEEVVDQEFDMEVRGKTWSKSLDLATGVYSVEEGGSLLAHPAGEMGRLKGSIDETRTAIRQAIHEAERLDQELEGLGITGIGPGFGPITEQQSRAVEDERQQVLGQIGRLEELVKNSPSLGAATKNRDGILLQLKVFRQRMEDLKSREEKGVLGAYNDFLEGSTELKGLLEMQKDLNGVQRDISDFKVGWFARQKFKLYNALYGKVEGAKEATVKGWFKNKLESAIDFHRKGALDQSARLISALSQGLADAVKNIPKPTDFTTPDMSSRFVGQDLARALSGENYAKDDTQSTESGSLRLDVAIKQRFSGMLHEMLAGRPVTQPLNEGESRRMAGSMLRSQMEQVFEETQKSVPGMVDTGINLGLTRLFSDQAYFDEHASPGLARKYVAEVRDRIDIHLGQYKTLRTDYEKLLNSTDPEKLEEALEIATSLEKAGISPKMIRHLCAVEDCAKLMEANNPELTTRFVQRALLASAGNPVGVLAMQVIDAESERTLLERCRQIQANSRDILATNPEHPDNIETRIVVRDLLGKMTSDEHTAVAAGHGVPNRLQAQFDSLLNQHFRTANVESDGLDPESAVARIMQNEALKSVFGVAPEKVKSKYAEVRKNREVMKQASGELQRVFGERYQEMPEASKNIAMRSLANFDNLAAFVAHKEYLQENFPDYAAELINAEQQRFFDFVITEAAKQVAARPAAAAVPFPIGKEQDGLTSLRESLLPERQEGNERGLDFTRREEYGPTKIRAALPPSTTASPAGDTSVKQPLLGTVVPPGEVVDDSALLQGAVVEQPEAAAAAASAAPPQPIPTVEALIQNLMKAKEASDPLAISSAMKGLEEKRASIISKKINLNELAKSQGRKEDLSPEEKSQVLKKIISDLSPKATQEVGLDPTKPPAAAEPAGSEWESVLKILFGTTYTSLDARKSAQVSDYSSTKQRIREFVQELRDDPEMKKIQDALNF
ncbi:hypothetical protein JYU14_00985 [Simkania negevensis]|uniref:Uncharacterized protein n=1 Tax=Simkania negevensis TaxID=83561 RepID=A0ABS3APN7_9BACT|nr:hypothetical protein [Simkania negevensis]